MYPILLLKAQLQCLFLTAALATIEQESKSLIPPEEVQENAQIGLELYKKFGGSDPLPISEALAAGKSLTMPQVDEMLRYLETTQIIESQQGWGNHYYPSVEWIHWQLMGGRDGLLWAQTVKKLQTTPMNQSFKAP